MSPITTAAAALSRLRDRLAVKLTLTIVSVAALILAGLSFMEVRTHRRYLEDAAVRGADLFGATIRASTHRDMLAGLKTEAYRVLEDIGRQEGIEAVRIFNKEGRIRFSSQPSEIGRLVDKQAEACDLCHRSGQPLVRPEVSSRWRVFRRNGHRVVGMVTAIYNEPSCWNASCHAHPESQRVLGVVDVGVSLARDDAAIADEARQTLAFSGLALVSLASIFGISMNRLVARPVAALVEGTHRVAHGDLSGRIPVHSSDELGRLAADFNAMAESLSQAREERQSLMAGLEQQVQERTAALRAAEGQVAHAEKMASLGRLSASIAHEINNPLTGVLTFAKLLIRDLTEQPLDEELRRRATGQLRLVQRETERCAAIVRNLLEFARQRPLSLRPVALNQVVEEALSLVGHQVELRGITLARDLRAAPLVEADVGQIRQAVLNLVMNACDATPSGGRIRVSTLPTEAGAALEVADTGPGIPEADRARIFDPFFSTKEKGTGLGLSVVYGIVERHNGQIRVLDAEGGGACFRITLRRSAATPA